MRDESTIEQAPESVLSTLNKDGKRRWLYPTLSRGAWLKKRRIVAYLLVFLYLGLPIFTIKGKPFIWLDILNSQFHVLGMTFFATDTLFMMLFGLICCIGVVLVTALAGRIWCGWGCPQTVYLEFVYRPIERLIEGKPNKARRRDEGEHDYDWVWRKVLKYSIFTLISTILAHTFVAYFVSWPILLEWMTGNPREHWGYFVMMLFLTGLVLFDFGIFREQMCTIACPYARIQSVLLDPSSMIVSYDAARGEPRGKVKKKAVDAAVVGDCVDCFACVRTCPTGIDIRDGLQMECLGCTQCIDACDDIMDKLSRPGGLIRYTSELALKEGKDKAIDWRRPRILVAAFMLMALSGVFGALLFNHQGIKIQTNRSSGAPFVILPDGQVANRLKISVRNMDTDTRQLTFKIVDPPGASLKTVGASTMEVKPNQIKRLEVWITVPRKVFKDGERRATIELSDKHGTTKTSYTLIGPFS